MHIVMSDRAQGTENKTDENDGISEKKIYKLLKPILISAGKVGNKLSSLFSPEMAKRSGAKSAKKIKII